MKFKTKEDWQKYLKENLRNHGGYAVVKHENTKELIYFARHTDLSYEGQVWFLESPTYLRQYKAENPDIKQQFIDSGYLVRNQYAYDIDCPQTPPFLPNDIEILEIIGRSEGKALDYLLKYDYKDYISQ